MSSQHDIFISAVEVPSSDGASLSVGSDASEADAFVVAGGAERPEPGVESEILGDGIPPEHLRDPRDRVTHWADHEFQNDVTIAGSLRTKRWIHPHGALFLSFAELTDEFPSPSVGMWALVGPGVPAQLWICRASGVWSPADASPWISHDDFFPLLVESLPSALIPLLDPYALKSDIPSLDGLASQKWVKDQAYLTQSDLEDFWQTRGGSSQPCGCDPDAIARLESKLDSMFVKEPDGAGGFRIKALFGLYTDEYLSARGLNPFQQSGTIGIDKQEVLKILADGGYITSSALNPYALKSQLPDLSPYALKSDIPSLASYALKSEIPTKTSHLTNDSDFTTNALLTAGLALKADKTAFEAFKDWVEEMFELEDDANSPEGKRIKARYGLYSDFFISARGVNPWQNQGAVGLDETQLAQYLSTHQYARLSDIPSLTGYATQTWVNQQGFLKAVAWADVTGKPTTIAGYGITDAHIKNGVITLGANTITPVTSLAGYATESWVEGKGYALASALTAHTGNTTVHITSAERTAWNAKLDASVFGSFSASYGEWKSGIDTWKATIDAFVTKFNSMFSKETVGSETRIKALFGLYTDQFLSARGLNSAGSSGGSAFNLMRTWPTSAPASTTNDALGANLGWELKQSISSNATDITALTTRVTSLEGKNYLNDLAVSTTGTGNAITSVSQSTDKKTLTFTKGTTFLTAHQTIRTLTIQKNGTNVDTFTPTASANKTINITDVASATTLSGHTSNTTVHITAAERTAWNGKVDAVDGMGLSANDFTDTLLAKLNGIEEGANKYTHPTGGANTTISAANGKVLSAITVNALGHVTSVGSKTLAAADIPSLDWSKITTGKPTTLSGYGITDAYTKTEADDRYVNVTGDTMSGNLTLPRLNVVGTASSTAYLTASEVGNVYFNVGGRDIFVLNNTISAVRPGTSYNNIFELGTSAVRWKNVYSVLGNFSGLITASAGIKIGDVTITYDSTAKGLKISGGGLYSESYISARGLNSAGGASGGGLIQTVYGSSDLSKTFSDSTLTDTFNAYTIKQIYTDLNTNKLNATKAAIEGLLTGNITSHTHSAYVTTSSIKSLTFSAGAFTAKTYTPTTAQTVSIPQSMTHLTNNLFVVGTQTAATNVWTGNVTGLTAYYDGLSIDYYLPFAGTSTGATLNLNGLGAKTVYNGRKGSTTTHYVAQSVVRLTYYNGAFYADAYYDSNSTYAGFANAYCNTAAATAAKAVSATNFALTSGVSILVNFTIANTVAGALTLNVNSTGAKSLYINGTVSSASNYTLPVGNHPCYYDGTNWHVYTDATYRYTNVLATKIAKVGGTSSQFLKADGSVDSNTYLTTSSASSTYLPKSSYTASDVLSKLLTVDGSGCGLDADLLDGKHDGEVTAKKLTVTSPTTVGVTVATGKTNMLNAVKGSAFGNVAKVGASLISNWGDDTFTTVDSSVYAVINVNPGYDGSIYGQYLLFSYGSNNPKIIGRNNSAWTALRTLAFTSDNVASATKLQTSRNIWGQSFDGSGNVSGNLTSVGNITGTASVALKAVGNLNLIGMTDVRLRVNDADVSSIIFNASEFRPLSTANEKIALGNSSYRWSNVFSKDGNFTGTITSKKLKIGSITLEDVNGNLHIDKGVYSDSFVSARGLNSDGSSAGTAYNRLDAWSAYSTATEGYVLSAKLGWDLKQNKLDNTKAAIEDLLTGTISTHSHNCINVQDVRDASRGSDYFGDKRLVAWFNNKGVPSDNTWFSGLHIKGWTKSGGYASWEIAGYASNGTINNNLFFRVGKGDAWNDWQTVVTDANYTSFVSKIGTATVGSTSKPIYLNAGTPTALSATVGSATRPVYLSGGTITAGTYTFGNASGNAPVSNGTVNTNLNADMLDGLHDGEVTARLMAYYNTPLGGYSLQYSAGQLTIGSADGNAFKGSSNNRMLWSFMDGGTTVNSGNNTVNIMNIRVSWSDSYWSDIAMSPNNQRVFYRTVAKTTANAWREFAMKDDNVASATKLATTRTLWGQNFNGEGNVTGNLTSVGNITGSAAMTISSTNGRLTLNAPITGVDLKFNNTDAQSVILNGTAFKPFDAATNALTLGSSSAVWKEVYARDYRSDTTTYLSSGTATTSILFRINTTEVARFAQPNGYLGLGKTDPAYRLDVNGAIRASSWLRTTGAVGWYSETYGGGVYMTDTTWVRTYSNKSFYTGSGNLRTDGQLQVGNAGAYFLVTADGKVGIGKTAPEYKLDVNGTIRTSSDIYMTAGDDPWCICANSTFLSFQTNDTDGDEYDALYIDGSNGNAFLYGKLTTPKTSGTYLAANQGEAIINSTASAGALTMLAKLNSTSGYFTHGVHGVSYKLNYTAKTTVDAKTNSATSSIVLLDQSGRTSLNTLTLGPSASPAIYTDANGNVSFGTTYIATGGKVLFRNTIIVGNTHLLFSKANTGAGKGLFFSPENTNGDLMLYSHEDMTYKASLFKFLYEGTFYAKTGIYSDGYVSARGQNTSSDARLKRGLTPFEIALRDIANAPSVGFDWLSDGSHDVGSIAQYWKGINPLLTPKGNDGFLTLQYGKTALLASISIAKRVVSHEERIEALERENRELKRKIEILERR